MGQFAAARAEYFSQLRDRILAGDRVPALICQVYPDPELSESHRAVLRDKKLYFYREPE